MRTVVRKSITKKNEAHTKCKVPVPVESIVPIVIV